MSKDIYLICIISLGKIIPLSHSIICWNMGKRKSCLQTIFSIRTVNNIKITNICIFNSLKQEKISFQNDTHMLIINEVIFSK